ncbi:MAG: RluA family pseudouridine synthase [Candidatus Binataceae bacterium]
MDRAAEAGERLDRHLVRIGLAPSRRTAKKMIASGMVRLNGAVADRECEPASPGDRVEVIGTWELSIRIEPNPALPLKVLYEDAAVIVINKPGGMPCHPIRAGELECVMNAVAARFPETATIGDKSHEGGLVHRLDNGTSGALIIARTPEAYRALRAAISGGQVARRYEALVEGAMDDAVKIDLPIAHHPRIGRKMTLGDPASSIPKRAGRPAMTVIEPIRRVDEWTLVAAIPATGCRHQIRVHLASTGHPIVGDAQYGAQPNEAFAGRRFWLHLCEVEFESPAAGRIKVSAPFSPGLKRFLN